MSARSGFGGGMLLYAALAAGTTWYVWSQIGPQVMQVIRSLPHGPGMGVGFEPPFDPSGLRPGRRSQVLGMRLDPDIPPSTHVEDRRGGDLSAAAGAGDIGAGRGMGPMAGIRCLDTYTGQDVPLSFCAGGGR